MALEYQVTINRTDGDPEEETHTVSVPGPHTGAQIIGKLIVQMEDGDAITINRTK